MKKLFLLSSLLLFFALGISAQTADKTVEKIRAYYNEIAEKAKLAEEDEDHGQTGELVMNQLDINKLNHQWRAVGIYQISYKFFYQGGDSEAHMYPDELVMVKVHKGISSRNYDQEFLYDKTGALVFYFQKAENDDQASKERRVYFWLGKAVRIVEDGKTRDKLTAADLKTVKEITADSVKIKDIFNRSIKL